MATMPDAALVEAIEAARLYAQDLLDNGHLFGAQIGGVMAIRSEMDNAKAALSQPALPREGWTPELEAARLELCEFLVEHADDPHTLTVHVDLGQRMKDAEMALTILADIVLAATAPPEPDLRSEVEEARAEVDRLRADLKLIHDRIPMDYLMPPGTHQERSIPDAMKEYSEARWRLIDRVCVAEAQLAEARGEIEAVRKIVQMTAERMSYHAQSHSSSTTERMVRNRMQEFATDLFRALRTTHETIGEGKP